MEQFQKIEALIAQRMEKFEHEEEAALLLYERVAEAQKLATMQVRVTHTSWVSWPLPSQHGIKWHFRCPCKTYSLCSAAFPECTGCQV